MVRSEYEKKGTERLKDEINKAAKKPLHDRIKWMSDNVRESLLRKRKDPAFMKRPDRTKKNRYSNQCDKTFDPSHRQGSISTVEVAKRFAAKKNGVLPIAADVYEKTHGFEMVDGETLLLGEKPKKTMEEYTQKLLDYKEKGVKKTPDEVFFEVVGGQKKGKVYGLGNASSLFYEVGSSSQTKQSPQSCSFISQLTSQLEEYKKMVEESKKMAEESKAIAENTLKVAQANQEAYEKEKEEWKKEKQEFITNVAKVKKVAEEVFQLIAKEKKYQLSQAS